MYNLAYQAFTDTPVGVTAIALIPTFAGIIVGAVRLSWASIDKRFSSMAASMDSRLSKQDSAQIETNKALAVLVSQLSPLIPHAEVLESKYNELDKSTALLHSRLEDHLVWAANQITEIKGKLESH